MKTQVTRKNNLSKQKEEIIYLSLLLSCVKDRLSSITPGIDCTDEEHSNLIDEKITLTLKVNKAILKSRGCNFVEETDATYTYNSTVLKLGGVYKQCIRA